MQETIRRRDVLERTNLTQSEIIAKLNHELQIPMLGVLANLEMMEKAVKEGQIARVHSLIHKSVNYGLYQKTLIGNMVYASVADIRDPFYISRNERSSLRECFELTADLIKDIHDGSIATGLPPDVWIACQDEILMIVLINVIGNSAEHAGRVGLEWRVSSSECHLLCENEIDAPLDLEAIFMPWNSTRKGGAKLVLGIGLNIAREILHSLGGSIEAEQDENRFMLKLTLPLAEADD
jgi:K+-sensing histidine kinase KdpD